jgi:hypothetical protein
MDLMNRAGRPAQPAHTPAPSNHVEVSRSEPAKKRPKASTLQRFTTVVLLISTTILVVALNAYLIFGRFTARESKYVAGDQLQAVFLNGGQVYFGKIRALNPSYVGMTDIYYLRVNQQVQPKQGEQAQQDISLVKLGCELHGPSDEMFINRSQLLFWENLKKDGQVAKAVENYIKENPDGQKCDAAAPATGDATPQSTTPAATTPTTKKP